jgi:hypothetical protein
MTLISVYLLVLQEAYFHALIHEKVDLLWISREVRHFPFSFGEVISH